VKDFYNYAIHKAHQELILAVTESIQAPNDKPELENVHYRLISLLHWSVDCWDRIRVYRKLFNAAPDSFSADCDFMDAFRRINNRVKHDKAFLIVSRRVQGYRFPINLSEPLRFGPPELYWKHVPPDDEESKCKKEKTREYRMHLVDLYMLHLSEKPLLSTCEQMVMIIDKYIVSIPEC